MNVGWAEPAKPNRRNFILAGLKKNTQPTFLHCFPSPPALFWGGKRGAILFLSSSQKWTRLAAFAMAQQVAAHLTLRAPRVPVAIAVAVLDLAELLYIADAQLSQQDALEYEYQN